MIQNKIRIFGLWQEYGWRKQGVPFNAKMLSPKGTFTVDKDIISYLLAGNLVMGFRTTVSCLIYGDQIGSPSIFTDGQVFWTNEYLHYIEQGMLEVDDEILNSIKTHNFKCPTSVELGQDRLIEYAQWISHSGDSGSFERLKNRINN